MLIDMGVVTMTCLPDWRAAMVCSSWFGRRLIISSILGFEMISAMDALGMAVWSVSGLGWMAMGVK